MPPDVEHGWWGLEAHVGAEAGVGAELGAEPVY